VRGGCPIPGFSPFHVHSAGRASGLPGCSRSFNIRAVISGHKRFPHYENPPRQLPPLPSLLRTPRIDGVFKRLLFNLPELSVLPEKSGRASETAAAGLRIFHRCIKLNGGALRGVPNKFSNALVPGCKTRRPGLKRVSGTLRSSVPPPNRAIHEHSPQSVACGLVGSEENRLQRISPSYIHFQNMRLAVQVFLTWRSLPIRLFLLRFGG
jgi:hypothetical protein